MANRSKTAEEKAMEIPGVRLAQKNIPCIDIFVLGPVIKQDAFGNILDISHTGYANLKATGKKKDLIFAVPATPFWQKEALNGRNRRYVLAGNMADEDVKPTPKKKEKEVDDPAVK